VDGHGIQRRYRSQGGQVNIDVALLRPRGGHQRLEAGSGSGPLRLGPPVHDEEDTQRKRKQKQHNQHARLADGELAGELAEDLTGELEHALPYHPHKIQYYSAVLSHNVADMLLFYHSPRANSIQQFRAGMLQKLRPNTLPCPSMGHAGDLLMPAQACRGERGAPALGHD